MIIEREAWLLAWDLFAHHGDGADDKVIDGVTDAIGDTGAVNYWRRVAIAVDMIRAATPESAHAV